MQFYLKPFTTHLKAAIRCNPEWKIFNKQRLVCIWNWLDPKMDILWFLWSYNVKNVRYIYSVKKSQLIMCATRSWMCI